VLVQGKHRAREPERWKGREDGKAERQRGRKGHPHLLFSVGCDSRLLEDGAEAAVVRAGRTRVYTKMKMESEEEEDE
jgi:hypothetical protein